MNRVILMGRLTRDPEIRTTQSGKQVARMAIAVDRRISRASREAGMQSVDFINLTAWDRNAEFSGNYLRKGSNIIVEGRLQVRSYEAQDGTKRTATDVVIDNIEFAGSRPRDDENGYGSNGYQSQSYSAQPQPAAPAPVDQFGGTVSDVTDDDIPF